MSSSSTKVASMTFGVCLFVIIACGGGSSDTPPPEINNEPPSIQGIPETKVLVGENYIFTPQASDPDGDSLTFSVQNLPSWADFNTNTGEVNGWPDRTESGDFLDILISVSDGSASSTLAGFDIAVTPKPISKEDVITEGTVVPLPDSQLEDPSHSGFVSTGSVVINIGGTERRHEQANLEFEFDEDDNLISMVGDTLVPSPISNYFSLSDSITSRVGLYLGAEINPDPLFGIQLKDDFYYFVYYLGIGAEAVIGNRDNSSDSETISLSLPGGEIVLISDPLDEFFYYYASTPLGTKGYGESDNGLIPFEPAEDFSSLDSFDGHRLDRAAMSIGIKIFDLFEIEGTRITKEPQFSDIDWNDPLNSPIEFKAGANGTAKFALSVFGVGLFDFELAQASATFDVGFDRQQMALQMTVEPDVSWQPNWFSIIPTTQIIGNWMVNGDGSYSALLSGEYRSTIPETTMTGSITLNNDGAIFESIIPDDNMPITVSASFLEPSTLYEVFAQRDVSDSIKNDINAAFDRLLEEKRQALQDYQDAIDDYEFEVSLRGLRETLPATADNAIAILQGLPAEIGQIAFDEAYDAIKAKQVCLGICIPSNSRIGSYARTAQNQARDRTSDEIVPYVAAMVEMKFRAQQADAEEFRDALEAALREVYAHRTYSDTVTVSFTVTETTPDFEYSYTRSVNEAVLTSQQSSSILNAADNAHLIQESSDTKIRLGDHFEQIPEEDIIERARTEINDGLDQLPTFEKAGMTVTNGAMTGYILLDETEYSVDFNILDPVELLLGVGDSIAEQKSRDVENANP